MLRHRVSDDRMRQINRIAGIVLIGFGALLVGEIVMKAARHWAAA